VHTVLPRLSAEAQLTHPHLVLRTSEPFGAHPALARLLIKRAEAAGAGAGAAIVLVAHGSPDATANRAVEAVAALAQAERPTAPVALAYLSLNEPDLPTAVAQLAATGSRQAVVVPYMLQLGGHVAEDLPALMAQIAACEPSLDIRLAEHLGYDPLLVDVILERIKE
jgi:sirohydrochlorin cobaltochelatase